MDEGPGPQPSRLPGPGLGDGISVPTGHETEESRPSARRRDVAAALSRVHNDVSELN